jgi:hypothetical protein
LQPPPAPKKKQDVLVDELETELERTRTKKKKAVEAPNDTDGEAGQPELSATAVVAAGDVTKVNKKKQTKK